MRPDAVPDFDIEGIFGKLASDDYDRAVQLARGFQGEAPRANATIAIARAVLEQKAAANSTREVGRTSELITNSASTKDFGTSAPRLRSSD